MKLSCNIIKDLLPLYVENMTSGDSRALIEEHVKDCGTCRAELRELRGNTALPKETDTAALEHLRRQIRRRRIHTSVFAILVTAAVLFSLCMYLYGPVYLSAEEAVVSVTETGDVIVVKLTPEAEYCRWQDSVDPDTGRKSVTFIAARHRWNVLVDSLFWKQTGDDDPREVRLGASKDIWYASTSSGEEDTLLWGQKASGGQISLPRLVQGYYFVVAILGGVMLLIPAVLLRKRGAGKVIGAGAVLCFSFALSDLIATGGNWRIYDAYDVPILLVLILIQTVLITASVIWGVKVHRMSLTDREE